MILVYVDGLAEPNPGVGTFGYVIYEDGKRIFEKSEFIGEKVSNNYAEYSALVSAFKELLARGLTQGVRVKSDSSLLVGQMKGEWKRKRGGYLEKYKEARELSSRFQDLTFEWVPRKQNEDADLLSRIAYESYLKTKRDASR